MYQQGGYTMAILPMADRYAEEVPVGRVRAEGRTVLGAREARPDRDLARRRVGHAAAAQRGALLGANLALVGPAEAILSDHRAVGQPRGGRGLGGSGGHARVLLRRAVAEADRREVPRVRRVPQPDHLPLVPALADVVVVVAVAVTITAAAILTRCACRRARHRRGRVGLGSSHCRVGLLAQLARCQRARHAPRRQHEA